MVAIRRVLGYVNARILLTVLFSVLLVPLALVWRLTGKDPLARRQDNRRAGRRIPRDTAIASTSSGCFEVIMNKVECLGRVFAVSAAGKEILAGADRGHFRRCSVC